jgi:uncharacterized protein YfaS (alpha-2-macroglobulin family)
MNKKNSFFTILITLLVFVGVYFIFFTGVSKQSQKIHARWISAHTSGTVSAHSPVKVYFSRDMVSKEQIEVSASRKIFAISPAVKGQVSWVQTNVLEFVPATQFENGETYSVKVDLSRIVDSLNVDDYRFDFQVIEQNFTVDIDGLVPVDPENVDFLKVYGTIMFADKTTDEDVHSILSASIENQKLQVKWEADKSGRNFTFSIDSIERKQDARTIIIAYNGKPVGVDYKGETTYRIPAKGEFILTSHKVQQYPEQQVTLYFSDPLKRFQDLEGLVTLTEISDYSIDVQGNMIILQPVERQNISDNLRLSRNVESITGKLLGIDTILKVVFEELNPAVRATSDDVILPPSAKGALFAFEAVNLRAVDVRVFRIYQNNVLQYLQNNNLGSNNELYRVGKPVFQQSVVLNQYANTDLGQWNTFYIDLTKIVEKEPAALYHIQIGYRHENAITRCDDPSQVPKATMAENEFWDQFDNYNYSGSYNWRLRDDPCNDAYYGFRRAMTHNFMVSDIGLIVKAEEHGRLTVFTTSLSETKPLNEATVEVLDFQQQVISREITNEEGKVVFEGIKSAYFIKAKFGNQTTYLRMNEGGALSYSHFPTDGANVSAGLKGFVYNERGVYRPGDTIFCGFMLHDLAGQLPAQIPVTFELYNARSQKVAQKVVSRNNSDHYVIHFPTQQSDETGTWRVVVRAGGQDFTKYLAVETVKPNRLKVEIDAPENIYSDNTEPLELDVQWLHGAPVSGLKVTAEAAASLSSLKFDKWPGFQFNHQEHELNTSPEQFFTGNLDEKGSIRIPAFTPKAKSLPSKINLSYFFKVFESNGNFSIASKRQSYLPYKSYVGLRLPEPTGRYNMYATDKNVPVNIAAVNAEGDNISGSIRARLRVYKVRWSWWWESSNDFGYRYRQYKKQVKTEYVDITNGETIFNLTVDKNEWGRYLIEITNLDTQQVASSFIYFDWPGSASRGNRPEGVAQNMLRFAAQKEEYETGETVELNFPTSIGGKVLVSIENGFKVIDTYWLDTEEGETSFSFKANAEMVPNCYVNVHYIQKYSQTKNDLPLRLYGVAGIKVTDPETRLKPVIVVDEELESGKSFELKVAEQTGQPMSYSIAIVDEGLLALTNFETPNPYRTFFAHEALGVLTYDIYDWVVGAFSNTIERVIGIGGGASGTRDPSQVADQRFRPVVIVKGPFTLDRNKQAVHKITLPPYIGEVRTMVVARNDQAFGKAEQYSKVKSPLMVMATAPRKLVMNDEFVLPVNIFRDKKSSGTVKLELLHDNNLQIKNPVHEVSFERGETEKMVYFTCKTGESIGSVSLSVKAYDGRSIASEDLNIEVYNPTPRKYNVKFAELNNNGKQSISVDPIGVVGTNALTAELSTLPPFNLYKHFNYLLNYPHGCIEQTVSGVFGLINIEHVLQPQKEDKERMEEKINAALKKLRVFQAESGGLSYWPGGNDVNMWGTNYAGHFMVAASKAGYSVDKQLYNKWLRFQKTMAGSWVSTGATSQYEQAYRLYTLALAGEAMRGPMNRLRGIVSPGSPIAMRLAAAYAVSGRKQAAEALLVNQENTNTTAVVGTYGSVLREQAMMLQTLNYLGKEERAVELIKHMSKQMTETTWHSTQTRGWVLYAVADFYSSRNVARKIAVEYTVNNGKTKTVESTKHVMNVNLPFNFSPTQNISFTNKSGGQLYLQLINEGQPKPGEHEPESSNLQMSVDYRTLSGSLLPIDKLMQTTDFVAEIRVKHPGTRAAYENLALTFTAPGGWEIVNTRFTEFSGEKEESSFDFRDFRDTQVMTYFDLQTNEEKVFYITLNATYGGTYYLAPVSCQAMYDNTVRATSAGKFVQVQVKH